MTLSNDPVALFLRSILAVGRRVGAERPLGSVSLSGDSAFSAPCTGSAHSPPPDWPWRSDRRELTIAITAKGRRVLLDDMAVRRAWLEMAMNAALTLEEHEILLSASAVMMKIAAFHSTKE